MIQNVASLVRSTYLQSISLKNIECPLRLLIFLMLLVTDFEFSAEGTSLFLHHIQIFPFISHLFFIFKLARMYFSLLTETYLHQTGQRNFTVCNPIALFVLY